MKFLITSLFFILSLNSHSAIIYVDINAIGSNNGTSWTNAFTDVQNALSIAFINDEIWVATGIYKPTTTTDRAISFVMKNGVDVYGGFDGTETNLTQRNIALNPTTLSGDIGQQGDNTDNTRKVVKIQNFTAPFTLDGFRILSGYDGSGSGKGAGMYLNNNAGPLLTFDNCIIYNNYAYHSGGGAFIDESNTVFHNCEFLYNGSFNYGGGGIYADNGSNSHIYLYDCKFIGNNSRNGTVIKFDGVELVMERNLISGNISTSLNLIYVDNSVTKFELNNSLIVGNQLDSSSGSIVYCATSSANASSITNSTICHNKNISTFGPYAECISNSNAPINIINCIVYGNTNSDLNVQIETGNNVQNCIVENGFVGGTTISSVDPAFTMPNNLAAAPFDASNFDYSLLSTSSAINFGDNIPAIPFTGDYLNGMRIQQGIVDCGAIESPFTDLQPPNAICSDTTVYLDLLGNVTIDSSFINNNSTDNIGITSYVLSQLDFDCNNVGTNTVTMTLLDQASNSTSCASIVTVIDNLAPTLLTQNLLVYIDAAGNASITANDIDNGSTDNCGIDTLIVSPTGFTCSDIGQNSVTFTAIDIYGNTNSMNVNVTVVDSVAPIAVAQDLTVYLNASGSVSVLGSQVDNGSTDDCGISNLTVNPNTFSCGQIGLNSVVLSVYDADGNVAYANAAVTVLDDIAPTTLGQDISINLGTNNPYTISISDINNGSSDNCNFTQTLSQTVFSVVGIFPVDLISTDGSGNTSAETYMVEVIDSDVSLEENETLGLKIYPNPVLNGTFTIDCDGIIDQIEVLDILGRSQTIHVNLIEKTVDVSALAAGKYYLRIEASEQILVLGFVR